jgi:hypothetical protein
MSLQRTCKVGSTRYLDVLTSLVNVKSIKVQHLTNRINRTLRRSRAGASKSDVVDWSAQKDDLPVNRASVLRSSRILLIRACSSCVAVPRLLWATLGLSSRSKRASSQRCRRSQALPDRFWLSPYPCSYGYWLIMGDC